jgi:hypothetical protein
MTSISTCGDGSGAPTRPFIHENGLGCAECRIEALGWVLLLSLMLWRLVERQLRAHVETTGVTLIGWDKKPTARPTAFMMTSKFAGILILKIGRHRHLARPLSEVQQQYLTALGLVTSCFTVPSG